MGKSGIDHSLHWIKHFHSFNESLWVYLFIFRIHWKSLHFRRLRIILNRLVDSPIRRKYNFSKCSITLIVAIIKNGCGLEFVIWGFRNETKPKSISLSLLPLRRGPCLCRYNNGLRQTVSFSFVSGSRRTGSGKSCLQGRRFTANCQRG